MAPYFNRQAQRPAPEDIHITKDKLHEVRDAPNEFLKPNGRTKLMQALLDGHREFVLKMLDKENVNLKTVDQQGRNLMHYAVEKRDRDLVKALQAKDIPIDSRDRTGQTPFLRMFDPADGKDEKPNLRFAAWLVKQGADPDAADKRGRRALHHGASSHGIDVVSFLLKLTKNADKPDHTGVRPFHDAVRGNNFTVVQEFTHHRVDLLSTTNKSETVFHLSLYNKDERVLDFLLTTEAVKKLDHQEMDNKRTALHEAVSKKQISAVRKMLDMGANINAQDKSGKTPLALAVSGEHEEIVRTLLDRGADIVYEGCSALEEAISYQLSELFPVLMEYGPNVNAPGTDGSTPLMRAMQYGHSKVATALLEAGADPKALNREKQNALFFISRDLEPGIVKKLIDGGADPNQKDQNGRTPLLNAMTGGYYVEENVKALVKAGADVNALDNQGRGVLHNTLRSYQPDFKMFDWLMEHGADPVKQSGKDGQYDSLLHMAAEAHGAHKSVLKKLLDAGMRVDMVDHSGVTPLQAAVRSRNAENVELLLEYGADPHHQDNYGGSAFTHARQTYNDDMMKVIEAFEERKKQGISPKYVDDKDAPNNNIPPGAAMNDDNFRRGGRPRFGGFGR
jgi:ankyrin repeat protein